MTPLFTWSGKYVGFHNGKNLFSADGQYLGWLDEDARVWKASGEFAGELIEENYVLRREHTRLPTAKMPHTLPMRPELPAPRFDRVARVPKTGFIDALAQIT